VLLCLPFDKGPLEQIEPQEGLTSTHDYLLALAERPERVFGGPTGVPGTRDPGWPGVPPLGL